MWLGMRILAAVRQGSCGYPLVCRILSALPEIFSSREKYKPITEAACVYSVCVSLRTYDGPIPRPRSPTDCLRLRENKVNKCKV
jgi:hypothetical protein